MMSTIAQQESPEICVPVNSKLRRAAVGADPVIFTGIFQDDVNIAIWQREVSAPLASSVAGFLAANPGFQAAMTVSAEMAQASICDALGGEAYAELAENIAELVDMFCCLFGLSSVGLRLTALDKAMCPKFHVDRVPCRLVTTYQGEATQWLPHEMVDRTKLGPGCNGKPDAESGLYQSPSDIKQLCCGDVALLKGERWEGNENAGLVHRSPALSAGEHRLLLTLDFAD